MADIYQTLQRSVSDAVGFTELESILRNKYKFIQDPKKALEELNDGFTNTKKDFADVVIKKTEELKQTTEPNWLAMPDQQKLEFAQNYLLSEAQVHLARLKLQHPVAWEILFQAQTADVATKALKSGNEVYAKLCFAS